MEKDQKTNSETQNSEAEKLNNETQNSEAEKLNNETQPDASENNEQTKEAIPEEKILEL